MIAEKTIPICGKEVQMRYCAASETGYELLSGKSSDVFAPTVAERNENGEIARLDPPKATADDYIKLAFASIIAAYERVEQEVPITVKDIIFDSEPEEVKNLITSVIELRIKWYTVPKTVPESEFDNTGEEQKNDQTPANASKDS